MYPIATWPEDVFLASYATLFLTMFVAGDLLKFRYRGARMFARWLIGSTVVLVAAAHLISDLGTNRIGRHWTGHRQWTDSQPADTQPTQIAEYEHYWGDGNRQWNPFVPNEFTSGRMALLPVLLLVVFVASQLYFRKLQPPAAPKQHDHITT